MMDKHTMAQHLRVMSTIIRDLKLVGNINLFMTTIRSLLDSWIFNASSEHIMKTSKCWLISRDILNKRLNAIG